jgi:hypothetical protein
MMFVNRANEQLKSAWIFASDKYTKAPKSEQRYIDAIVESFLEPYMLRLEQAGRVLVVWDGFGPAPDDALG